MSRFLDTNILAYAHQIDPRSDRAKRLIEEGGVVSIPVINEFANVLHRKFARPWRDIEAAVQDLVVLLGPLRDLDVETSRLAIRIPRDHSFAFYDALIIAAAIRTGCDRLLSEDMQSGRVIEGVTIVNPFLAP